MQLLAHPFRLAGGRPVTVTDGSDAALADAVARMVLTRPGELELVPAYGVPDPVWSTGAPAAAPATSAAGAALTASVDVARLNACLSTFGPACTVTVAGLTRDATGTRETVRLEVTR